MSILIDAVMIVLFVVSIVTACFGPRKWLRIAAVSAFIAGFLLPIDDSITSDILINSLCFSTFWVFFIVITSYRVKKITPPRRRK